MLKERVVIYWYICITLAWSTCLFVRVYVYKRGLLWYLINGVIGIKLDRQEKIWEVERGGDTSWYQFSSFLLVNWLKYERINLL